MVESLLKSGEDIASTITPEQLNKIHCAIGVSGEAGELLDAIKKEVVYNRAIDRTNIVEELGDLEFYMDGLRRAYGITRDETIQANMDKLAVRYQSGKYSDKQAQDRADKEVK